MAAGANNLALQCKRKIFPWTADSGKSITTHCHSAGTANLPPLALAASVIEFQPRPLFLREEPLPLDFLLACPILLLDRLFTPFKVSLTVLPSVGLHQSL
jgi:hypothetical protein